MSIIFFGKSSINRGNVSLYPCGWLNDPQKAYGCAPAVVTKYQKRISGPLLDRIDVHIEVSRVDYEKLSGDRIGETSESIRKRVQAAIAQIKSSACSYHHLLKLARTIADLAGSEEIQSVHLAEAFQYRPRLMMR